MRTLLIPLLSLLYGNSSYGMASQEFEEQILCPIQPDYFQEDKITYSHVKGVGSYTPPYDSGKHQDIAEFIIYDEESPKYLVQKAIDGKHEFIEEKVLEGRSLEESKKENAFQEVNRVAQLARISNEKMTKVSSSKAQTVPYKFVGVLLITFPHTQDKINSPTRCIGSGVLVGPNHVLTAGHNLYDHKRGGWAQDIMFTPAQHKTFKPFGTTKGTILRTFRGWIQGREDENDYDIGLIILSNPIGYKAGWISLLNAEDNFLASHPTLTIIGYSLQDAKLKTKQGVVNIKSARMYKQAGILQEMQPDRLLYDINTLEGQNGAPIITDSRVLGIHTHREGAAIGGSRITANKFERILETISKYRIPKTDYAAPTTSQGEEIEEYEINSERGSKNINNSHFIKRNVY
ncbi:MAG: trypsin-like serine protease [Alphaproteobacteria bacterium]|nr:trypsin-like serine protease [Alphaproteobacteria bacterium]